VPDQRQADAGHEAHRQRNRKAPIQAHEQRAPADRLSQHHLDELSGVIEIHRPEDDADEGD